MLNLSQETKAVSLFGSVYRLRPVSPSSCSIWVKWRWTHHDIPHFNSAWSRSVPCGLTAEALLTAGCVRLWREAAETRCPSTEARIPGRLLERSPGEQRSQARLWCMPPSRRGQGGYNQICCTTESTPQADILQICLPRPHLFHHALQREVGLVPH